MSYAGEVREELATLFVKKPCCRRAQLWGLLRFAAAPDGSVRFLTHSRAVAQMTSDLLADLYHGHNTKIQDRWKQWLHLICCKTGTCIPPQIAM